MKKLLRLNPFRIIVYWILVSVIFSIIGFFIVGVTTPAGEQKPLIFLSKMIPVIVYGVFLLSGVTVPFFLKWIKTKWYVNLIFFLLSLGLIIGNYLQEKQYSQYYDEISTPIEVDGNQYDKVIQYYNKKNKLIRRIGVELDGEKDSTWTTFDRNGEIISVEYYRNGSLIKR